MKAKKIEPLEVRATVSAEELLKEKGLTREEWNNMIAEKVGEIEADDSLDEAEKEKRISNLLMMAITRNNRFLFEELAETIIGDGE